MERGGFHLSVAYRIGIAVIQTES